MIWWILWLSTRGESPIFGGEFELIISEVK